MLDILPPLIDGFLTAPDARVEVMVDDRSIADLPLNECIRARFASGALAKWEFERAGETLTLDPPARLVIGTGGMHAAFDLAIAGHVMVHSFRNRLDPHLDSGAPIPVLANWWRSFDGRRLYFSSPFLPASRRAFVGFIAGGHAIEDRTDPIDLSCA